MTDNTETRGDNVSRMMSLFTGFSQAFGQYDDAVPSETKGGKLEIKATARTVRAPVTRRLWEDHLKGTKPLGIIPIRENNTCLWGVIDVDTYDLSFKDVVDTVAKHKLPLVACRSKSGGVHLFLFLKDPVAAAVVQARLKEMAALLGFGGSEVFPKQREVREDSLANWLNMPYFQGDETDRYGIKPNGLGMTFSEFLGVAEDLRQPQDFLKEKTFSKRPDRDPDFGDGPPCMQHLAATGFPEGSRNKGLFALASFAKRKYGTRWEAMVEEWNRKYFDPPLPAAEVIDVIKSQTRKEYNYTCREQPLCAHCNSSVCRTRKFGVGGDEDLPQITGLQVLESDPPLWFMDIDGETIELSTEQLQNYRDFHKVCMEKLFVCFRMMKSEDWLRVVSNAMKDATRIQVSSDVNRSGQFYELVEDFVLNRHRGANKEDLLVGRPWLDTDTDTHYFRLRDLKKYLDMAGFKGYTDPQIVTRLKAMGGDKKFVNIKGRGCNTWVVPNNFSPVPTLPLPEIEEEPI